MSTAGCHDNRMDKASWNEQWMGRLGPHYAENSNYTAAHKLEGKLLLAVSTETLLISLPFLVVPPSKASHPLSTARLMRTCRSRRR